MNRLLKTLVAVIGLLILGGGAYYLYTRWRERPLPTVTNWRATVSTFAGDGLPGVRDDVVARVARFADPFGVALDRQGNLYVADAGASNRIRKLTPQGAVGTFAGGAAEGFADGTGAQAAFDTPSALALDTAGNLYVADTGNHRVRKVTPDGVVTTLAGDGKAGWRDGAAAQAEFNAPIGVAVDPRNGNIYVADTYNDRIRLITTAGQVQTIAGGGDGSNSSSGNLTDSNGGAPGYADGAALSTARFDTPCALVVAANGDVLVADTGNDRVRRLTPDGQVSTFSYVALDGSIADELAAPMALALTHDNFLYVAEAGAGRITQIAPDHHAHLVAGVGTGFADGDGWEAARFLPGGIAVNRAGDLYVADSGNFVVRLLTPATTSLRASSPSVDTNKVELMSPLLASRLTADLLGVSRFPWPIAPQDAWHEVAATVGEVRGSYDGEARDHLHSGVDVRGAEGELVRAVFDEKVRDPNAVWGFNQLHEGLRINLLAYIHLRVGRDGQGQPLPNAAQFSYVRDAQGKIVRVRVQRGARFRVGDPLGAINRMYHVHLNFGPTGRELNPLTLPFIGFSDTRAPVIEPNGVQLFSAADNRLLKPARGGRLDVPRGDVRIVVDAYDQVDGNLARRRLGLYRLGYQVLLADGTTPAPGFAEPRVNFVFDQLPPGRDAVQIAYADTSGITVYGSAATKFLYEATNTVSHGQTARDTWHAAELPPGNYVLRIYAADLAGNVATANREVAITLE